MHGIDIHCLTSICRNIVAAELVVGESALPVIALCAKQGESPSLICSAEHGRLTPCELAYLSERQWLCEEVLLIPCGHKLKHLCSYAMSMQYKETA